MSKNILWVEMWVNTKLYFFHFCLLKILFMTEVLRLQFPLFLLYKKVNIFFNYKNSNMGDDSSRPLAWLAMYKRKWNKDFLFSFCQLTHTKKQSEEKNNAIENLRKLIVHVHLSVNAVLRRRKIKEQKNTFKFKVCQRVIVRIKDWNSKRKMYTHWMKKMCYWHHIINRLVIVI